MGKQQGIGGDISQFYLKFINVYTSNYINFNVFKYFKII